MKNSRFFRSLAGAAAICAAAFAPWAGHAADLSAPDSLKDTPDAVAGAPSGNMYSTIPAGVTGAAMLSQGETMVMYMPMAMGMDGNYIGTDKISTQTILNTPNHVGMGMKLSIVPDSMDAEMHMFGAEYGITNAINVMVMGSYIDKSMTMTSYYEMAPRQLLGTNSSTTDGFGDVTVTGLFRLYEDGVNHIHLNLGLSLPTGSTTEQAQMISPMMAMPTLMTMRAMYGMQLGTGTVDLMPGLTYTGNLGLWSWGAAYRGRFALDNNDEGYHWGDSHQLTGWLGYTFYPGVTATARVLGTVQGKISGMDPDIGGPMQGTNPAYYGGEVIDLLGGIEIAGHEFGLGGTKFAIEAGAPIYQDLNGPQIGQSWQLNAVFALHF